MEHVSFTCTPIVLSSSGSWGPSATMAFMRQTRFLSVKLDQPYSRTLIDIPPMQSHPFPVCNVCNLIIIYSIFTKQQLIYLYTTCTIYSCLARSNMQCIGKQYSTPIRRVCTWREQIGIEIYIRCALYIIQTNNMCTCTHACVWIMFTHRDQCAHGSIYSTYMYTAKVTFNTSHKLQLNFYVH